MSMQPKIELKNVKKHFGEKKVLDGIDLKINDGDSLVIIGGSGTGKSVTIKCILGLLEPTDGAIKIDGENVLEFSSNKRERWMKKFGMLFQGGALFDSLKVWENISFGLNKKKKSKKELRQIAIEKLAQVGMPENVADLMPAELSGGMQKRVSLARAIAGNPEIIFFDEPTTGLDPIMADVINDLIVKCRKDLGSTTFTITHDMASVRKIATHVAMLYEGKIIWHGTVDKSKNEYVRQFINGEAKGPIKFETGAK